MAHICLKFSGKVYSLYIPLRWVLGHRACIACILRVIICNAWQRRVNIVRFIPLGDRACHLSCSSVLDIYAILEPLLEHVIRLCRQTDHRTWSHFKGELGLGCARFLRHLCNLRRLALKALRLPIFSLPGTWNVITSGFSSWISQVLCAKASAALVVSHFKSFIFIWSLHGWSVLLFYLIIMGHVLGTWWLSLWEVRRLFYLIVIHLHSPVSSIA